VREIEWRLNVWGSHSVFAPNATGVGGLRIWLILISSRVYSHVYVCIGCSIRLCARVRGMLRWKTRGPFVLQCIDYRAPRLKIFDFFFQKTNQIIRKYYNMLISYVSDNYFPIELLTRWRLYGYKVLYCNHILYG